MSSDLRKHTNHDADSPGSATRWVRPSGCSGGACVEVSHDGGGVLLRDSKRPDGPVLAFTAAEWVAFVAGAKAGEFDGLALA